MIQESEIQSKLAALEAGGLPLWDFYDWIESASLNMHRDSSPVAMKLVGRIKHLFADYDLGLIDQESLTQSVSSLLHQVVVYDANAAFTKINVTPLRWVSSAEESWFPPACPVA